MRPEETQAALTTPRDNTLDLLPNLPIPRTITISLPPTLVLKLDKQRGRLTRSYVVRCAIEALLDGVEKIRAREKLLERSE